MQKKSLQRKKEPPPPETKSDESPDRRNQDRRKVKSHGYIHIPVVGWYCRREKMRRDDDGIT